VKLPRFRSNIYDCTLLLDFLPFTVIPAVPSSGQQMRGSSQAPRTSGRTGMSASLTSTPTCAARAISFRMVAFWLIRGTLTIGGGTGTALAAAALVLVIAVLFAVLLVIPGLVTLLPEPWNDDITRYLPNSAAAAMSAVVRFPNLLSPAGGLIVLSAYTAAALTLAALVLTVAMPSAAGRS
jgi:hypothetical protein